MSELWQLDAGMAGTHPARRRDSRPPAPGAAAARKGRLPRLEERAGSPAYGTNAQAEDQWHLPDGRTLHVVADSEGEGGVTYLYENVTERLELESRYNALIEVQSETLDTLREGVAVFAPNGRLRLHNRAFAAHVAA